MNTETDTHKAEEPLTKSTLQFPVIGIGASAGGLDAFKKLIKAIPEHSGMAYIFVQHLAPTHESVLPSLLQKVTAIRIYEITDNIQVLPDHIYIIPANKLLIANDGVLELKPRPPKEQKCMPIDIFFTSLAEVHGPHAIGIVLSGTGSDGTLGLKAIKDYGGLTFAEDQESAAFEGMPNSAVHADVVDFILKPEDIPKKISDIKSKIILTDKELQTLPQKEDEAYKQILILLRTRRGTDFTYYKQTTIRRRILRRIAISKMEAPALYLKYLRESKAEQDILYQDLLIPVTSFFRDPKIFAALCESVFPNIIKSKSAAEPIRIWIAGCSTGQEAYSIAICLKEFIGDLANQLGRRDIKLQIYATDISEPAIAKARSGVFTIAEVDGLTPERLQEFFTKIDGSYQVKKSIRDLCVFAVHNFLKDPPFAKVDLVSCRNVLIYMEPFLQKNALTAFHYALNPKGYLLLGKAETPTAVSELFGPLGKSDKLFIRKDAPGRFMHTASQRSEQQFREDDSMHKKENIRTDFQKAAEDILLNKYTPACVIVNESMDIVHFRGSTGMYLEPSPGKASLNLLKMAKNGLAFELRNILNKAKNSHVPAIKENIPVLINDINGFVTIEAIPLPNIIEPHFLILFRDKIENQGAGQEKLSGRFEGDNERDVRIQQLEQELLQLREDMRTITEEQEAANEELQSANEELLSGSEELQSMNEELETSKEELQSTNEELTIVNQEMISLNDQIQHSRNYAESIVTTIREPLVVLDKNFRVKTANLSFYKTFNVSEAEIEGALFFDMGKAQWNIHELRIKLEKMLTVNAKFTDMEVIQNFSNGVERIFLMNANEIAREYGAEKFILLTMEDVTDKLSAHKKIEDSIKRYHMMLMQSPFAFSIMKGKDMVITLANDLIKTIWGKGLDVEGKTLLEVLPELKDQPFHEIIDKVYKMGNSVSSNEMLARINYDGKMENRYFNVVYQPHLEVDETISGVITIAHEVTNQVNSRRKIEESERRFRNIVEKAPSPICILKGDDMILEVANEPLFKIWDVGREALGKPFLEIIPEMKGQPFMGWLLDVYKNGVTHYGNEEPAYFTRQNGEKHTIYFNFVYQPYHENDGSISGVMVLATDVTEQVVARKKIEAQALMVKDLLMTAPGFVATLSGPDHVYELVNEQYQGLFGKRKIKGKPIMKALPELQGQGFDTLLDRVYLTGESYVGIDIPIRLARDENLTPEDRFFNFSYQPMYDENRKIYSILVFGYEVTDQVIAKNKNLQIEQSRSYDLEEKVQQRTLELIKANEDLKKMNLELESFTFVSSHDLQEPLRKIQTFVSRIFQTEYASLSDTGKDYFNRMNKAAGRMQTLIEDLLEYSHAHISDRKFVKSDLSIIVKEVVSDFSEALLEKSATIDADDLGEADISPFQFRQVINNLISNALKFSKTDTPPHITIKSKFSHGRQLINENPGVLEGNLSEKQNYCHIIFTDNGIGFEPEYKELIFQVFQRLHGKDEYAGTGIGLAIVKKIVENHNGYITAMGEVGKGARFDIYLPQQ